MTGAELREWRENRGWKQSELMAELKVRSRQTVTTWENCELVPHVVALAIIALDQVEAARTRTGYKPQFTADDITNMRRVRREKAFEEMHGVTAMKSLDEEKN